MNALLNWGKRIAYVGTAAGAVIFMFGWDKQDDRQITLGAAITAVGVVVSLVVFVADRMVKR